MPNIGQSGWLACPKAVCNALFTGCILNGCISIGSAAKAALWLSRSLVSALWLAFCYWWASLPTSARICPTLRMFPAIALAVAFNTMTALAKPCFGKIMTLLSVFRYQMTRFRTTSRRLPLLSRIKTSLSMAGLMSAALFVRASIMLLAIAAPKVVPLLHSSSFA